MPRLEFLLVQWNREVRPDLPGGDVEQVATLQIKSSRKNFAYTTQTTLSVDDTRGIIDALRERFPANQKGSI